MGTTVRDIAKKANTSPSTVSRYFSGSKNVSPDLAERIETAAKSLGYQYKRQNHRPKQIAVLIPDITFEFNKDILNEIIHQAEKYKFRLIMIPTYDKSRNFLHILQKYEIDGVICLDEETDRSIIEYLVARDIKTVMCAGASNYRDVETIHVNEIAAAYDGTQYLLGLGHRKILFLADNSIHQSTGFQRHFGCLQAMKEKGLVFDDTNVRYCSTFGYDDGYRLTKQAIQEGTEFTAIFAFSDETALGALSALHDMGRRVPEDVSVLGFDGLAISEHSIPRLTTIKQPIEWMVAKAFESLAATGNRNCSVETTLPYELLVRESCRAIGGNE